MKGSSRVGRNPVVIGLIPLTAGLALTFMQYKIPTIMTGLMGAFDMSAASATWLMSIFALSTTLMAIPAGSLSARFGPKRMIVFALFLAVIGSLVGIVAGELMNGNVPLLMASRAVEGAALGIVTTCGPVLIQQAAPPEHLGTSMGVWGVWGSLGSSIAAVVVPVLFSTVGFGGLWGSFAFAAVVSAAIVAFGAAGMGERTKESGLPLVEAGVCGSEDRVRPRYSELLTPDMAKFFLAFLIFNVCLLAIPSFVPTFLQRQGIDPSLAGFISTAPMLMSIAASPLYGALSDKLGRRKPLLVLEMLVMGPCTCAMFLFTGPALFAAVVLMGAVSMGALGLILSAYTALIPRPELVSMAMGVLVLVQGLGQFLGTFLIQLFLGPQLDGVLVAGVALMLMCFVAAAAFFLCRMK